MRELSNLEISSISAGVKSVSDMTVPDYLQWAAAAGAAWGAVKLVETYANITTPWVGCAVQAVCGMGGLVGGWLAAKVVNEQVTPYL